MRTIKLAITAVTLLFATSSFASSVVLPCGKIVNGNIANNNQGALVKSNHAGTTQSPSAGGLNNQQ